ncbi:death domain-containing protein 1 [Pholidichthys leucotaenia]
MDEAKPPYSTRSGDSLLIMLTETIQWLKGVRHCRDHHNGARGEKKCFREEIRRGSEASHLSPAGDERGDKGRGRDDDEEEKEYKMKALGVLRDLSVFHSDRLTAWREALRECVPMLDKSPPRGPDQPHPSATENTQYKPISNSFCNILQNIREDIDNIMDTLTSITTKLDAAVLQLSSNEVAEVQECRDTDNTVQPKDPRNHLKYPGQLQSDFGYEQNVEKNQTPSQEAARTTDSIYSSSSCNNKEHTGAELPIRVQVGDFERPILNHTDLLEENKKDQEESKNKGKEWTPSGWITVGLTGQLEGSQTDAPDTCFIRAPVGVAEALRCEVSDTLSCLMVTGSEELISKVIQIKVQDGITFHFPITMVLPFRACYRGSYRDIAVKVVDEDRRASYLTPVATEGVYGGQKGSFAEVKVYSLGIFAVVSCPKRESYTVPRRGLALKLPMDSRVCLNYLPGSFTTSVMAQTMIQPVDAVLLASVKYRNDAYHPVVSTSPLLYLTHPTSQHLRRPLTVTLPCPPNPEKNRATAGQAENQGQQIETLSPPPTWDNPVSKRVRIIGTSVKANQMTSESLVVVAYGDKQWSIPDKVTVRNQQKGLVSFDLTENFERLLVVRLLSPLQSSHLTSLAEELELSVCCHAVTVVLQRGQNEPHTVLVAAVPSRELSWELNTLQAQGYSNLETSPEIYMCEADQLLLHFSGNITSVECIITQNEATHQRLTFHSQRKNRLIVHLTEVDPFGNYSSPHYKGTAVFYKVTRSQLEWRGNKVALKDTVQLGDPVCKLPLTLPKKVRNVNRPIAVRVKLCEDTDSLSDSLLLWLSGELSEEDVDLLALSLRLRRSTAQLVKLRAKDSVSSQAFHILATWRRGLPAISSQPKASQLAHCLAKSGRPDLARELLLRQAAATK